MKTPKTSRKKPTRLIETYAAQCGKCSKWRYVDSQEEYETIRSETPQSFFQCKKSCQKLEDVDVKNDSSRIWFLDSYGLPKTPRGLKRISIVRANCEKVDVYYVTPQGKRLRSPKEVVEFIQDNEEFKGTDIEDISFISPKRMKKTTNA